MNRLKWVDVNRNTRNIRDQTSINHKEEKLRTFIAFELEQEANHLIGLYIERLKRKFPSGFRWVKTENLHFTLKFLGDTPVAEANAVSRILDDVCINISPFKLQIQDIGVFPSWQRPRTIWMGLKSSVELDDLFRNLDLALNVIGIPLEGKKFSPHLTLCRVSDYIDLQLVHLLREELKNAPLCRMNPWEVNKVVYYKSHLQSGGPIYTPLSEHRFMQS